jgi:spermidine synthase
VNQHGFRLAVFSGLILFFELALIRFTAGYVHLFSFYLNFVLIATFLGMGVGLMRAHQADRVRWLAIPASLLLFLAVSYFAKAPIAVPADPDEFLWSLFTGNSGQRVVGLLTVAATLFTLCAIFFVPLGALMGAEFRQLPPLQAYAWDIGGGLAGILSFGVLSALRQEPFIWVAVGFLAWIAATWRDRKFTIALAVAGAGVLAITQWMNAGGPKSYWSPYYRINVKSVNQSFQVDVNGSLHQFALDLDPVSSQRIEYTRTAREGYLQPYRYISRVDTALVVGAGTGNDLAILLQRGAKHVDAVEIDPVIAEIGRDVHPQQPYSDPRVELHVNDARAFLRTTPRKYDVIVFGTLDSQTLLSGMSSVRLDNYVYTVESFRSARARLREGGTLIVYHMSAERYIAAKIYQMIGEAFGEPPGVFWGHKRTFNVAFVAGGAAKAIPPTNADTLATLSAVQQESQDDWPYLYLRTRTIPGHYLSALVALIIVSLVMTGLGGGASLVRGFDGAMFFMGAGFLLVETKSVTEMSLLFGSTWTVNLLVFSSILVMVLAANVIVMRRPPSKVVPLFVGLFASLAIAWSLPASRLLGLGVAGQWLVGGLMVALPIFFAALIFSTLLSRRVDGSRALAYNLLGAIMGGALEYSSMVVGIKGLYLIAATLYFFAMALAWRNESLLSSRA